MTFYDDISNFSNFVISFMDSPRYDFGIFASGYFHAASKLAEDLLSKGLSFPDYEAYPIMFLYRHALELYLKNIIYKSALLSAFKNMEDIDAKLYNHHDLNQLSQKATDILRRLFLNDKGIELVSKRVLQISSEFSKIDPDSFSYRYPIDRNGNYSTKPHQVVNLEAVHHAMCELLEDLDTIDFGLNVETSQAQELYEMLSDL